MPVLKLYQNGTTSSMGHRPGDHERAPRGTTKGWTYRASRGNTKFLWSVKADQLTGAGFAVTLTVRDCPSSSVEWAALRRAWIERIRRRGLIRLHWITEWQRRGHPHMHAAVWMPEGFDPEKIALHWLEVARQYRPGRLGQDVRPITGQVGWFQYLGKHATRSASNYQRSPENVPAGWEKTGRVWGHVGDWPTEEAMEVAVNFAGWYRWRRLVLRYAIANARARRDYYRVGYLRRYLQFDEEVSRCRGTGDWIPQPVQLRMLAAVGTRDDVEIRS